MSIEADPVREFEAQRARLFAVAYRMLGMASEAEDVVQDAFLRWHDAEHDAVRSPAAWLTKVVTNLCLTRLGSARSRRERYVGPWLPEPVVTGPGTPLGPLEDAEQRDSVSLAMLVLLERLTPPERAAFVLREAFAYSHREIADVLDLSETHCQQLYSRARRRIEHERPRFSASREDGQRLAERFLAAARGADVAGLERLFAADVVSWADGGGNTRAARNPIRGANAVARYLGWMGADYPGLRIVRAQLNGQPGLVAVVDGVLRLATVLDIADGRIVGLRHMTNPDKLGHLAAQLV